MSLSAHFKYEEVNLLSLVTSKENMLGLGVGATGWRLRSGGWMLYRFVPLLVVSSS